MTKLFIPLILGTAREGRESEKVARYVLGELAKIGTFTTQLVDVKDHLFGKTAEHPEESGPWQEIMTKADGLIIVSPEYNRGIPGELKILLDSLDEEYVRKPVAIVGVSSGKVGGARMAEAILPTLVSLGMVPITPSIQFPVVQGLFSPEGKILEDSYEKRIHNMFKELTWFAEVLKKARG